MATATKKPLPLLFAGDRVRLDKKGAPKGFGPGWTPEMDKRLGQQATVVNDTISLSTAVKLSWDGGGTDSYAWPIANLTIVKRKAPTVVAKPLPVAKKAVALPAAGFAHLSAAKAKQAASSAFTTSQARALRVGCVISFQLNGKSEKGVVTQTATSKNGDETCVHVPRKGYKVLSRPSMVTGLISNPFFGA